MMTDDSNSSDTMPEKPTLRPANENPWYVLATLHGEFPPAEANGGYQWNSDFEIRNRTTWNKYISVISKRNNTFINSFSNDKLIEEDLQKFCKDDISTLTDSEINSISELWRVEFARRNSNTHFDPKSIYNCNIEMRNLIFTRPLRLNGFIFPSQITFNGSHFQENFEMINIYCKYNILLRDCIFHKRLNIENSNCNSFSARNSIFESSVSFDLSKCRGGPLFFDRSKFNNLITLHHSQVKGPASFVGCDFIGDVGMIGADFQGGAFFNRANFKAQFIGLDTVFRSRSSFSDSSFKVTPPKLHGATLHEGTEWHGVTWPPAPSEPQMAQQHVYNYERLKQEMERLKKHEDELKFFALEMRAKRVVDGKWSPAGIMNAAYGGLSGYGRSVARPFWLLLVSMLLGVIIENTPKTDAAHSLPSTAEAYGLSLSNTFAILPFVKDAVSRTELSALTTCVGVVQGGIGALMLFLIGLGLRNRFRLR